MKYWYETSLNCIKAMPLFEGLTRFPMHKTEYSMADLLPLFYQVYSRYSSVHPCMVLPGVIQPIPTFMLAQTA